MKQRMKTILSTSGIILLVAVLFGCNLGVTDNGVEELSTVTLTLEVPDYSQHLPPVADTASASRATAKVIDPATDTIYFRFEDSESSLIVEKTITFLHEGDDGGGNWNWESGDGYITCWFDNVPLGRDTTIYVETRNEAGDPLTAGASTVNIDAFRTYYNLRLEPVDSHYSQIVLDQNIGATTIDENVMMYYRFDPDSSGRYIVKLHSTFNDVNLYLYRGSEEFKQSWFQSEPPIDEAIVFEHNEYWSNSDYYYIGVYGGLLKSYSVSTIQITSPIDLSVDSHIVMQTAHSYREIDLASAASDPSAVTLQEMLNAIQNNRPWDVHYVGDDGDGHIVLYANHDSYVQMQPGITSNAFDLVWGVSGETTNTFELTISRYENKTFEFMGQTEINPVDEPYQTVVGELPTKQLWGPLKEYPFREVNLGFTFYFNGTPYNKVYVSPNGYVSFWKYRLYYSWWYWYLPGDYWYNTIDWNQINNWYDSYWWHHVYMWGWQWLYEGEGTALPNELVALYRAPFYFATDPDTGNDSGVYYQKRINGDGKNEFVIEYKDMYHRYDPQMSRFDRYFSGQIVLTQGDHDTPLKDGTITLKYDRVNSEMTDIRGFIGIENNTGEEMFGPGSIPIHDPGQYTPGDWPSGVPAQDIQFLPTTGGFSFVVE